MSYSTSGTLNTDGWLSGGTISYVVNTGASTITMTGDQMFDPARTVEIKDNEGPQPTRGWHPKIVMKALKTAKLRPAELKELSARLKKLSKIAITSQETGQVGLYETVAKEMACIVKEQEAAAIGYGLRIDRETIKTFVSKTRDRVIKFDRLENFPRTIPKKVREKIEDVRSRGVFDEFWVVYVDYTKEEAPKTTKDKIREKDPILFGSFSVNQVNLHYIVDWVDKYCDLTISKLVDAIQEDDPEFELDRVPDPSDEYLASVVANVERNIAELSSTNSSNYLAKMLDQEKQNREALEKQNKSLMKKLKAAGIDVMNSLTGRKKKTK